MNVAGDRENFFCVKLYHRALIIFSIDREEVEEFSDVPFAAVKVTFVPGSLRNEVVCKLLKNRKSSGRVKIEYIGVLLSVGVAVRICEQAWILRTKSRLHIKRWACHIGEHEYCRPLRNRHAGR